MMPLLDSMHTEQLVGMLESIRRLVLIVNFEQDVLECT